MDNFILRRNIKEIESKINLRPLFIDYKEECCKEIVNIIFIHDNWILGGGLFLEQALTEIRKIYHDTRLIVAGTKPNNFIVNSIEIDDYNSIEFEKYYNENSIMCVPYLYDSLGMPIMNAMSHNLPVITTRSIYTEQYIKDNENGFFVEKGNKMQLVAKLLQLISNKNLRRKIGANAYGSVISNYHVSDYSCSNKLYV
ncbi:MAG: glycosyltransferase family 4 protein [Melioribacteraceae bacterium]|nr:glycosyltransferase family 4 protein [Melioribacteraceae bacterium]